MSQAIQDSLAPFERGGGGENPYKVQADLQETMQAPGRHRPPRRRDDRKRSRASRGSRSAPSRVGVDGHREYHSGWHTALDLQNLLAVSEAIARSAIERKESRGGHFREDYPDKVAEFATINIMVKQGADGAHAGVAHSDCRRFPTT